MGLGLGLWLGLGLGFGLGFAMRGTPLAAIALSSVEVPRSTWLGLGLELGSWLGLELELGSTYASGHAFEMS